MLMALSTAIIAAPGASILLIMLSSGCGLATDPVAERPDARIVATYPLEARPIGEVDGVIIRDGGYSGLNIAPDGELWVLTDRGPNLEAAAATGVPAKRFPIPAYEPKAQQIRIEGQQIRVSANIPFLVANRPATGLPPPERDPKIVVEIALGPDFQPIQPDPEGIDSEGIAFLGDKLYVSDEYRPSIWELDAATGQLLRRFTPTPLGPLDRPLPQWLLERTPNLGFEGLAIIDGLLYAALQGPLTPAGAHAATRFARILQLNPTTGEVQAFAYLLDGPSRKIGDLAATPDGRLLVLEHGKGKGIGWSAEIYALAPPNLQPINPEAPAPELFRDAASAKTGSVEISPKSLYVDLLKSGWSPRWDKPEGLAINAKGQILLVNDNDYGLSSPQATGAAVPTNAETVLVVIE